MPTQYRGTDDEVRALNTYIKLVRAAESVTARLAPQVEAAGLTSSQLGALEALFHLGPMCQRDLGRKLLKSGGNITLVVDNLEKQGLARRERERQDRRFVTVHLTESGRQLIAAFFPRHAAAVAEQMSVLTLSEQEELGRLCRKLGLRQTGPEPSEEPSD
jgi:MarR family transcriptional regulator, 2-MHQ and catechol-resistance regulon repressor